MLDGQAAPARQRLVVVAQLVQELAHFHECVKRRYGSLWEHIHQAGHVEALLLAHVLSLQNVPQNEPSLAYDFSLSGKSAPEKRSAPNELEHCK